MTIQKNKAVSYEKLIIDILIDSTFMHNNELHKVLKVEKPKPSKGMGEVKTDIYILTSSNGIHHEFKISLKMSNAEFVENKITKERLDQFPKLKELFQTDFGDSLFTKFRTHKILTNPVTRGEYLEFNMGARLDLMTYSGTLYQNHPILNKEIIREAYLGENATENKRNAKLKNRSIIVDAGIPNFFLELDIKEDLPDIQIIIDSLIPIDNYLETHQKLYPALRCVNLRVNFNKKIYKIENRSLILPVHYNKITSETPLENVIGAWGQFSGEYVNSLQQAKEHVIPHLESFVGFPLKRA